METAQLSFASFPQGARLEGAVAGAIERMQATGEPRLLDALFVACDPESGELAALDLATGVRHGTIIALLEFRLAPGERRRLTQRTLAEHAGGVRPAVIEAIGDRLASGEAALAALVAGGEPRDLLDAVARSGGRVLVREHVDATRLADVAERLVGVASATTGGRRTPPERA
jgi:hypothetical protein